MKPSAVSVIRAVVRPVIGTVVRPIMRAAIAVTATVLNCRSRRSALGRCLHGVIGDRCCGCELRCCEKEACGKNSQHRYTQIKSPRWVSTGPLREAEMPVPWLPAHASGNKMNLDRVRTYRRTIRYNRMRRMFRSVCEVPRKLHRGSDTVIAEKTDSSIHRAPAWKDSVFPDNPGSMPGPCR